MDLDLVKNFFDQVMPSGFMCFLLVFFSLIGLSGLGRLFKAPYETSFFVGGILLSGIVSVLAYIRSNLCYSFILVSVFFGYFVFFYNILRDKSYTLFFEKKRLILIVFTFSLSAYFLHKAYPGWNFIIEKNTIKTKFISDVYFRSMITQQILESNFSGPLASPTEYPYFFPGYHLAAEALIGITGVFFTKANIISYAYSFWILLVFLISSICIAASRQATELSSKLAIVATCFFVFSLCLPSQNGLYSHLRTKNQHKLTNFKLRKLDTYE
jgi:hypothetical protein